MKYNKGLDYQLVYKERISTEILGCTVDTAFYSLAPDGSLTAYRGYSWDGASGGVDTKSCMRASLFHDVLCQMVGKSQIPPSYQDAVNDLYYEICRADGMNWIRANWQLKAIQLHFRFASANGERKIYESP